MDKCNSEYRGTSHSKNIPRPNIYLQVYGLRGAVKKCAKFSSPQNPTREPQRLLFFLYISTDNMPSDEHERSWRLELLKNGLTSDNLLPRYGFLPKTLFFFFFTALLRYKL